MRSIQLIAAFAVALLPCISSHVQATEECRDQLVQMLDEALTR